MGINSRRDHTFSAGCLDPYAYQEQPGYQRQNATFVMLTRNQELSGVLSSMYSVERHFNQWFQYPYVFLNDEEFSEEFIAQVRAATHADVEFGVLSELEWEFPTEVREQLVFKHSIEDQAIAELCTGTWSLTTRCVDSTQVHFLSTHWCRGTSGTGELSPM